MRSKNWTLDMLCCLYGLCSGLFFKCCSSFDVLLEYPMTNPIVTIKYQEALAVITIDDGKRNVVSPQLLFELNHALDQAEERGLTVVLIGREGVFSAGFDLNILKGSPREALAMLMGGFKLSARLLSFPTPIVIACTGHAMAMGAFLLLSADYRIGTEGAFHIVTNEVAIGLTMPATGVELCRQRLTPAHFTRSVLLAEYHTPTTAVEAGFLDRTVAAADLYDEAIKWAQQLAKLDMPAHHQSKLRARHITLKRLKRAIMSDRLTFVRLGLSRMLGQKSKG